MRKLLFMGLLCWTALCWPLTVAVVAETIQDVQAWVPLTLELPTTQNTRFNIEVQPRFTQDITRLGTARLRPSFSWMPSERWQLTSGYFYAPNLVTDTDEHRAWQQALYTHALGKSRLQLQSRLEARFVDNDTGMGLRARQVARWIYPLSQNGWSVVLSEELMWNLLQTQQLDAGFDQSRTFLGVRKQYTKHFFAEAGYMAQFVNGAFAQVNQLNHILMLRMNWTPFSLQTQEHVLSD